MVQYAVVEHGGVFFGVLLVRTVILDRIRMDKKQKREKEQKKVATIATSIHGIWKRESQRHSLLN